jgi:hypothetical protein
MYRDLSFFLASVLIRKFGSAFVITGALLDGLLGGVSTFEGVMLA